MKSGGAISHVCFMGGDAIITSLHFQRVMTNAEGCSATWSMIIRKAGTIAVKAAGGSVPARFCGHPRRTIDYHYPFQKGSNTFGVCRTTVNSSIHSISMLYAVLKLSDKGMSR